MSTTRERIISWFEQAGPVVVALSGGVDSSLAAALASQAPGADAVCATVDSALVSRKNLAAAQVIARKIGMRQELITLDLIKIAAIAENAKDRCYHCKKAIVEAIMARFPGRVLVDGTNADDDPSRPGRKALEKAGARSPFLELGITKKEIRTMAYDEGLSCWNRPGDSCLATRIGLGRAVTRSALMRVEELESLLGRAGFSDVRVRDNDPVVTCEIPCRPGDLPERVARAFTNRARALGFGRVVFEERMSEGEHEF